ncbi:MAG: tetratricopeptide repeat protein [Bacteroidota bacterium]
MKRYSLFAILLISVTLGCVFTGFQCGSTEMTSAKLYLSKGDYPNAETALAKEVQKNPANTEAWYNLGFTRLQLGKFEEMLAAFDNCMKNGPEFNDKIKLAKLNAWGQLFNQAVASQKKMEMAPKDNQGNQGTLFQDAEAKYQLAIKINPDSAGTYQNLAALYRANGSTDKEIATWQKARERKDDPNFTSYIIDAEIKKSEDARAKGDKQTADEYLNKAIEDIKTARTKNPDDSELLNTMINLYIEADRSKEAMPYMRIAIDKDPKNKVFQNDLGLLLMQTDSLEESVTHFAAAVATDSTYEDALRNGSVAYSKLGQKIKEKTAGTDLKSKSSSKAYTEKFKIASIYLEKLVSMKPDNPDFWDALASAYGNAGMFKDAENAIKKADSLRKK